MKIRPKMKQIVFDILSEENYLGEDKSTMLISSSKWSLDELKMLARVMSINYHRFLQKLEHDANKEQQEICDPRDDKFGSVSKWDLPAFGQGVCSKSADESSDSLECFGRVKRGEFDRVEDGATKMESES